METETEVDTRTEQERHADVYGYSREQLERMREKEPPDNGGSICSICHVRGCRIGPMARG